MLTEGSSREHLLPHRMLSLLALLSAVRRHSSPDQCQAHLSFPLQAASTAFQPPQNALQCPSHASPAPALARRDCSCKAPLHALLQSCVQQSLLALPYQQHCGSCSQAPLTAAQEHRLGVHSPHKHAHLRWSLYPAQAFLGEVRRSLLADFSA